MSTANEQPGSGMPEEPVEPADPHAEGGPDAAGAEPAADGDSAAETETSAESTIETAAATDGTGTAAGGEETEQERVARERVEFEKLVAAFHGESAPDPQGRPEPGAGVAGPAGPAGPHKIIRYPVLDPRPEWEGSIVEPTDEITADPLDYVEHYEPPDPELPQASAATLASWTMLIGGVAFLVLHALLGWQTPEYLGWLAVIGVFGGIITLVARMKPDRDEYDDPDNGAVV